MIACVCVEPAAAREKAQRVKYADEAGSAHIAIMSITPWDEAKADLQPTFPLSEADALAKVLPSTGQLEDRLLDVVVASLKVATPTLSTKGSSETKTATGQPDSTTTDYTSTRAPGDVSKAPDVAFPSATAAGLPGAPSIWSGNPDNDPMLQILAATALKQEYALVNRYVKDAAIEKGTRAYVVRMQFTTLPSRRNLPYDIFTNVSFLPGDVAAATARGLMSQQACKTDGVIGVVPLLVTDDIEGMLVARTTDKVRQFGFSLLAMLSGIGISGSAQKTADNLTRSLGKDLNSLFTIARLSTDTIRVRLGANSSPAPVDYAMVPRTHNISLLVTVAPSADADCFRATAVARTEFHDTEKGTVLKERLLRARDQHEAAAIYGNRYIFDRRRLDPQLMGVLAGEAGQSDMASFRRTSAVLWSPDDPLREAKTVGLYSDLLATKAGNYFTYAPMTFDTAKPSPIMPALNQAVIVPVTKGAATVHLNQGLKLAASDILATLRVGNTTIVASSVTPTGGGTGLDIALPALKPFGIAKGQPATLELSSAEAPVAAARSGAAPDKLHVRTTVSKAQDTEIARYSNIILTEDEDSPPSAKPAFTLDRTADVIVAASDSSGQVAVLLKAGGGSGSATIGLTGADLTAVTNTSGNPVSIANGVMTVGGPGAATLSLRNLRAGGKVGIQLYDAAGKKSGDAREIPVQAAAGKAGG